MESAEYIPVTESKKARQLQEAINEELSHYSVALTAVERRGETPESDQHLCGSGTLVRVGKTYAVLTAQHVLSKSRWKNSPLVSIVYLKYEHGVAHKRAIFRELHIAKPTSEESGPDLAAIVLPMEAFGWLREKKRFVNLESVRRKYLANPLPTVCGVWATVGTPVEEIRNVPSERDNHEVFDATTYCMFSGPKRSFKCDGFDYLDIGVERHPGNSIPNDFRGVSGGGLWQVPLDVTETGEIVFKEPILSGVAFYQSTPASSQIIRCHGRMSLWEHVYNSLAAVGS